MKNTMVALGLVVAWLGITTSASAFPVDCLLEVHGKTLIKGVCEFTSRGGGDFQIDGKEGYFAQLSIYDKEKDKSLAGLNINEGPGSTHAQRFLGDVRRQGACWVGDDIQVCARALSAAKRAKIEAERPNGVAIEWQVAGYPMICMNDFKPGTDLQLGGCVKKHGALPMFFKPIKGDIRIDKHPDVCIAAKPTDRPDVSKLVLEDCKLVSRAWHTFSKKGWFGKVIHSEDGLCWSVNEDPKYSANYILAIPCRDNMSENHKFDFYKGG